MLAKLGETLVVYLRDRLLPSLGCTSDFAAEYARILCEADAKQLRDFLRQQLVAGK